MFTDKKSTCNCYKKGSDKKAYIDWKIRNAVIAYVCPHCGCEMFGDWKTFVSDKDNIRDIFDMPVSEKNTFNSAINPTYYEAEFVKPEIETMQNLKECPCCGTALSHEKGHYIEVLGVALTRYCGLAQMRAANNRVMKAIYTNSNELVEVTGVNAEDGISAIFDFMKEQRSEKEKQYAEEKCNQLIAICDVPVVDMVSAESVEAIKHTPSKLQEYISNLINLETNIYGLSKRLAALYSEQVNRERALIAEKHGVVFAQNHEIEQAKADFERCQEKVKQYELGGGDLTPPTQPQPPVLATPNFLNKKKVLAENEALTAKYQADMAVYAEQVRLFEIKNK